nr:hypothetical protein [Gulosibacter sediminis]
MRDLDGGGGLVERRTRRLRAELGREQHEHGAQALAARAHQVRRGGGRDLVGVLHLFVQHLLDAVEPLVEGRLELALGRFAEQLLREASTDRAVCGAARRSRGGHVVS